MLLASEQVQKELEIVDEQKEKLQKLGEEVRKEMQERFRGSGDLSPEERRAQWQERRAKWEKMSEEERRAEIDKMRKEWETRTEEIIKKVEGILLPHQMDRLKQIQLQVQGGSVTSNPKVAEELKITEEQKEKLRKIRDELQEKMRGFGEKFRGLRDLESEAREAKIKEIREEITKLRKEAEEKALAVLTGEQRAKLEKMIGKKFEFDWSQMRRGRGRRPGGEGGRRPGGEGGQRQ